MEERKTPAKPYEPPALTVVGTLHDLTQTSKIGMKSDGVFLSPERISNTSP